MNRRLGSVILAGAVVLVACGGGDATDGGDASGDVTLLAHDSFAVSEDVWAAIGEDVGGVAAPLAGGDAGLLTSQAILSAGNPAADVLFGVDSTLLTRAVEADVFEPYRSPLLDDVDPAVRATIPDDLVTPIDTGEVCVNVDRNWFAEHDLPLPSTLDDLVDPAYADLLVVMDPASSSPGLAFLLATVARYGEGGWQDWWEAMVDNGVEVSSGWQAAYDGEYTAGSSANGDRPMMVSYASSPPAELVFAEEPKPAEPASVVLTDSCYRQIEYAGVLRGTKRPEGARQLIDAMLSEQFQADVPLQMFVFPVRQGTALPPEFDVVTRPAEPLEIAPEEIAEHRDRWIEEWTSIVLR